MISSIAAAAFLYRNAGEVFCFPVWNRKEDGDHDGAEHFEQVGIDLEPDADLHNNVVDDAADANAEQLERKVAKNLAEHGVSVKDKTITLMGGGGAGTAIFVQLALDGASEIHVFNRKGANFEKLEKIAKKILEFAPKCKIQICDLADEKALYDSIGESDILVNATNVGMKPNEEGTMIQDTSVYREDLVVAEIIYNPKETRMMREAKEAGVKCVVGGKGMLLWQGAEAFHLFTGQEMPVEEVKAKFFTE